MTNKLIKIQNLNINIIRNTSGCSLTSQIQTGWIWNEESTTKTIVFCENFKSLYDFLRLKKIWKSLVHWWGSSL